MIIVDTAPRGHGHIWRLINGATGELLLTGSHPYQTERAAYRAGARQVDASRHYPITEV